MSNREWWPAFMADEVMPQPESSPTEWVREALGERWLIAERVEDRCDEELTRKEIAPGETMKFIFCDWRPDVQIRVYAGGDFELLAGEIAGANNFSVWHEPDFIGSTPAEVAEALAESGELGEFILCSRYWSDEIPHRFEIGAAGPCFVPLPEDAGAKP